jgi:hypothetical protein
MGGQMEGSIWLTQHAEARRIAANIAKLPVFISK